MKKSKLIFLLCCTLIAIATSLLCVFFYGKFFSHDRYWNGTIERVSKVQIESIEAVLALDGIAAILPRTERGLNKLFSPYNRKLVITAHQNGKELFSNYIAGWEILSDAIVVQVDKNLSISISRYGPPSWVRYYGKWITRPTSWFEPAYDFITVPFLLIAAIVFSVLYALGWRHQAKFLDNEVLKILREH